MARGRGEIGRRMTRREWLLERMHKIKRLYNGVHTLYGPYNNSEDGRWRVVLYDGERRITRQYAKIKMEIKLGRRLHRDETVNHIDDNFLNDRYYNLEILDRPDHIKLDAIRVECESVPCLWCDTPVEITVSQRNRRKNKTGPFCSRSCTGKYGAYVQNGGPKLKANKIVKRYYQN